jgi:hypothetical protein
MAKPNSKCSTTQRDIALTGASECFCRKSTKGSVECLAIKERVFSINDEGEKIEGLGEWYGVGDRTGEGIEPNGMKKYRSLWCDRSVKT